QAEDGIRDFHVTGVQTCALPILARAAPRCWVPRRPGAPRRGRMAAHSLMPVAWAGALLPRRPMALEELAVPPDPRLTASIRWRRSEERRVGKEPTSRWALCQREQ